MSSEWNGFPAELHRWVTVAAVNASRKQAGMPTIPSDRDLDEALERAGMKKSGSSTS
jgi:hypothetical protein